MLPQPISRYLASLDESICKMHLIVPHQTLDTYFHFSHLKFLVFINENYSHEPPSPFPTKAQRNFQLMLLNFHVEIGVEMERDFQMGHRSYYVVFFLQSPHKIYI